MAINEIITPEMHAFRQRTRANRIRDAWAILRGRRTLDQVRQSYLPQADGASAIVIRGYGRMSPERRAEIDRRLARRAEL